MSVDLLCMGEPMLEFNMRPVARMGGGFTSKVTAVIPPTRRSQPRGKARGSATSPRSARMPRAPAFSTYGEREGVDASTVIQRDDRPTAVYFVTHSAAGHAFLHYRAGSAAAGFGPADVPIAAIRTARMLYASGISQGISDSAADAVFAAIDVARASGVAVAYDTNYRPRLWPPRRAAAIIHAAVAQADYALPSFDDVTTLTGIADPDAALDFYLRLGPKVVALKMGETGAYVATAASRYRLPAFAVRHVDATGAGDTFCGSFLARILAGDDPIAAARYASVAAALKCTGFGAVAPIPRAAEVRRAIEVGADPLASAKPSDTAWPRAKCRGQIRAAASSRLQSIFCMKSKSSQRSNLRPTSASRPASTNPNEACSRIEAVLLASIPPIMTCFPALSAQSIKAPSSIRPTPRPRDRAST